METAEDGRIILGKNNEGDDEQKRFEIRFSIFQFRDESFRKAATGRQVLRVHVKLAHK